MNFMHFSLLVKTFCIFRGRFGFFFIIIILPPEGEKFFAVCLVELNSIVSVCENLLFCPHKHPSQTFITSPDPCRPNWVGLGGKALFSPFPFLTHHSLWCVYTPEREEMERNGREKGDKRVFSYIYNFFSGGKNCGFMFCL